MAKKIKRTKKDKETEELMKVFAPSDQPQKPPKPRLNGVRSGPSILIGPGGKPGFDYNQIIGPGRIDDK